MPSTTLAILAALATLACAASAELSVDLTVTETAGIARTASLVSGGVPLPRGLVQDTKRLAVVDEAGRPVACQITPLSRWQPDKSLSWVRVEFRADVAAKQAARFRLVSRRPTAPKQKVTVKQTDDGVIVDTGAIRFRIAKDRFRPFCDVWLTGTGQKLVQLVGPRRLGLVGRADGEEFAASLPPTSVVVEDAGPLTACIAVRGRWRYAKRLGFGYIGRIYASAGSPVVRLVLTFENVTGKDMEDKTALQKLALSLKANVGADAVCQLAGEGSEWLSAKLTAGEGAAVSAIDSTTWRAEGEVTASGNPKRSKPLLLGLGRLSGKAGSVSVGVARFWQLWPKVLSLRGDGQISIDLVSAGKGVDIYPGVGRTHQIAFAFEGPGADPATARQMMADLQRPLRPVAAPAWMCRTTRAFGPLIESDPKQFPPANRRKAADFDKSFAATYTAHLVDRDRGRPHYGIDSYGLLAFGDTIHHVETSEVPPPAKHVQWDSSYYDFPHALFLAFARTGNPAYLRTGVEAAWHLADVDICHYVAGAPRMLGAARAAPSNDHVRDFKGDRPATANETWNFYKNEGLYDAYHFTGERRFLEMALRSSRWALTHDGYCLASNTRSVPHGILGLLAGYRETGEMRYAKAARKVAARAYRWQDSHEGMLSPKTSIAWQMGLALEGYAELYHTLGDKKALVYLAKAYRAQVKRYWDPRREEFRPYLGVMMMRGLGELHRCTGDDEVRRIGSKVFADFFGGGRPGPGQVKGFAQWFRSAPYYLWDLSVHRSRDRVGPVVPGAGDPLFKTIELPRSGKPPTLDGKVSQGEYAKAVSLVLEGFDEATPTQPTTVHLASDGTRLYIAAVCMEEKMAALKTDVTDRDGKVYRDDSLEIYLDPGQTSAAHVKIGVTAAGVIADYWQFRSGGRKDFDIRVKTRRLDDRYVVELSVPLDQLAERAAKAGDRWGFNVFRLRQGTGGRTGEGST